MRGRVVGAKAWKSMSGERRGEDGNQRSAVAFMELGFRSCALLLQELCRNLSAARCEDQRGKKGMGEERGGAAGLPGLVLLQ